MTMVTRLPVIWLMILTLAISACWWKPSRQRVAVVVYRGGFDHSTGIRLYLRGATPNEVHFTPSSFAYRPEGRNAFGVIGRGFITWQSNKIQIDDAEVLVNGKQLPAMQSRDFIIEKDGKVTIGAMLSYR